ncbi:MAG: hypothetical protein NT075_20695 [Chloroflexi bacterium]|nr:hypothetical protein [Chloroflexota bacterium]
MKYLPYVLAAFSLLLASCIIAPSPSAAQPPNSPVVIPAPTANAASAPGEMTPAEQMAIQALGANLGVTSEEIKVVQSEAVDWPDGCLGVATSGMMCTQMIVPGYRIVLEAQGQQFEYHTNRDGSILQAAGAPADASAAGAAETAQTQVIKKLADTLHVAEDAVTVVSNTSTEWPDACLGVVQPGIMCAQVITPGYLVVLTANGQQYEYHTDQTGSQVLPATVVLTWHREGGIVGFCDDLTIYQAGEIQATWCKPKAGTSEGSLPAVLSKEELAQFNQWLTAFGQVDIGQKDPAVADAMTVTLTLSGHGTGTPTSDEEAALLTFAQTVLTRVQP